MQQKNYGQHNKAGQVVFKKALRASLLLSLSILLILLAFGLAGYVLERFIQHPPQINDCLNGGGIWFYALNGCSD